MDLSEYAKILQKKYDLFVRIVAAIPKILLIGQNSQKIIFFATILHPLWAKVFKSEPLHSITFPQGFRKSKMLWYWTLRSWGKNTFKQSEQMKKIRTHFFFPQRIYTLYEQKFSNLRPLLSIRGFSGELKNFVKPEIRLIPPPVNKTNSDSKLRLKPSPVNKKFAYSLSPDFLFSPSPDFVYTRETSTFP